MCVIAVNMDKQKWNERYGDSDYFYGTDPNEFLVSVAQLIPSGRVLCLADGEGRNGVYLAGLGYEVWSIDQSEIGLAKARRLADESGVTINTVVTDIADFNIDPGSWSGIVSMFCHLPQPLRGTVHGAAVNGLVRNGVFVLEGFTPRQLQFNTGGPPCAELMMTLADLRGELAGLRFDVGRELDRESKHSKGHRGKGAVVQLCAINDLER